MPINSPLGKSTSPNRPVEKVDDVLVGGVDAKAIGFGKHDLLLNELLANALGESCRR